MKNNPSCSSDEFSDFGLIEKQFHSAFSAAGKKHLRYISHYPEIINALSSSLLMRISISCSSQKSLLSKALQSLIDKLESSPAFIVSLLPILDVEGMLTNMVPRYELVKSEIHRFLAEDHEQACDISRKIQELLEATVSAFGQGMNISIAPNLLSDAQSEIIRTLTLEVLQESPDQEQMSSEKIRSLFISLVNRDYHEILSDLKKDSVQSMVQDFGASFADVMEHGTAKYVSYVLENGTPILDKHDITRALLRLIPGDVIVSASGTVRYIMDVKIAPPKAGETVQEMALRFANAKIQVVGFLRNSRNNYISETDKSGTYLLASFLAKGVIQSVYRIKDLVQKRSELH